LKNGSKWSNLAKRMKNRTEHSVKNRFFCLISKNISIPVTQIKREKKYLSHELLRKVINEIVTIGEKNKKDSENENKKINFESICVPKNVDDFFDYETFIALGNGYEDHLFVFNY